MNSPEVIDIIEIVEDNFKNVESDSSASTTIHFPDPSLVFVPYSLIIPPLIIVGL